MEHPREVSKIGDRVLKLLLVDDSAVNRRVVSRRLTVAGRAVLEADGMSSGCALDASGAAAALLDLDLGDGSGIDLARYLRKAAPTLPIAFFTAGSDAEAISRAKAFGPVFAKPAELDAAVAWALSQG
jgi:two-component system, response regulator RegA